jgi:hypothetical protein
MQNLKAVAMGMVTARALLWSNKPNPAMHEGEVAVLACSSFIDAFQFPCEGKSRLLRGFYVARLSPRPWREEDGAAQVGLSRQ